MVVWCHLSIEDYLKMVFLEEIPKDKILMNLKHKTKDNKKTLETNL